MSFIRELVEQMKDEDTSIAADGTGAAEFSGYIDTGSFLLNAAIGGSIYRGVPNNKVLAFAGEEATGKTFYALGIVKHFLDLNPLNCVVYYDSEAAVTKEMMTERGIDAERVAISEPETIQSFRTHVLKTIEAYMKIPAKKRSNLLMVLDSLGNLPTLKEVTDSTEGKETKDMTRAGTIRATFRTITLKLGKAKIPMLVTNHTYESVGSYVPMKVMSGGGGLKYAASTIIFLSKRKEKDKDEKVIGNIITTTMVKSRMSKENSKGETLLTYKHGLDRHHGLIELGLDGGLFTKDGLMIVWPDGRKAKKSLIYSQPDLWFTKEILDQIDVLAKAKYQYGDHDQLPEYDDDEPA